MYPTYMIITIQYNYNTACAMFKDFNNNNGNSTLNTSFEKCIINLIIIYNKIIIQQYSMLPINIYRIVRCTHIQTCTCHTWT